jgi:uncharacterized protein YjbJ (UPF0337 family)
VFDNNPVWNRIQGNWQQLAGHVQQQWGKLTSDDIAQINGDRTVLAGKLQDRYGITQMEANHQIDTWANSLKF